MISTAIPSSARLQCPPAIGGLRLFIENANPRGSRRSPYELETIDYAKCVRPPRKSGVSIMPVPLSLDVEKLRSDIEWLGESLPPGVTFDNVIRFISTINQFVLSRRRSWYEWLNIHSRYIKRRVGSNVYFAVRQFCVDSNIIRWNGCYLHTEERSFSMSYKMAAQFSKDAVQYVEIARIKSKDCRPEFGHDPEDECEEGSQSATIAQRIAQNMSHLQIGDAFFEKCFDEQDRLAAEVETLKGQGKIVSQKLMKRLAQSSRNASRNYGAAEQINGHYGRLVTMCRYGRGHSVFGSFPKTQFAHWSYDGEPLVRIDMVSCHPNIFAEFALRLFKGVRGEWSFTDEQLYAELDEANRKPAKNLTRLKIESDSCYSAFEEVSRLVSVSISQLRLKYGTEDERDIDETAISDDERRLYRHWKKIIASHKESFSESMYDASLKGITAKLRQLTEIPGALESAREYQRDVRTKGIFEKVLQQAGEEARSWNEKNPKWLKRRVLKSLNDSGKEWSGKPKAKTALELRSQEAAFVKAERTERTIANKQVEAALRELYAFNMSVIDLIKNLTHGAATSIFQKYETQMVMDPQGLLSIGGIPIHDEGTHKQSSWRELLAVMKKSISKHGFDIELKVKFVPGVGDACRAEYEAEQKQRARAKQAAIAAADQADEAKSRRQQQQRHQELHAVAASPEQQSMPGFQQLGVSDWLRSFETGRMLSDNPTIQIEARAQDNPSKPQPQAERAYVSNFDESKLSSHQNEAPRLALSHSWPAKARAPPQTSRHSNFRWYQNRTLVIRRVEDPYTHYSGSIRCKKCLLRNCRQSPIAACGSSGRKVILFH